MRGIISWILLWAMIARGTTHIHHKHILRHGCLVAKMESVAVVHDVMTTEVTFDELNIVARIASNIAHKLTNIGSWNSPHGKSQSNEVIQLEKLLDWKMEQAKLLTTNILQDVPEPWLSKQTNSTVPNSRVKRVKRGWFDLGGAALGKVFGLATENDFREVNKKLQRLSMVLAYQGKVASAQNEAMMTIIKNLNAETATDEIIEKINTLEESTIQFQHLTVIFENLDIIINQLDNIRSHYQAFMKGVSSAGDGRITVNLLPIHSLRRIITIGVQQYQLKPLFLEDNLHLYYPYLEATLTPESILIHVPFITTDLFTVYRIHLFPSKINHTLATINTDTETIIISKEQDTVAIATDSAMKDKCRSSFQSLHLCPAYIFTFQPADTVPCELAIINDINIEHHCNFTQAPDKLIHHQRIGHSQFFYFTNNVSVYVTCPDVPTTHTTAVGLYTSPDYCSVLTPSLTTLPTRNHYAILNHTHRFFQPLPNIMLNMSSQVKLMSPQWETIKLINQTLQPWEEFTSGWLDPYFIYAPAPTMTLIFTVILIIFIIAMRRMADRITYLEKLIKNAEVRQVQ